MKTAVVTMLAMTLALAGCGGKPEAEGTAGSATPTAGEAAARSGPGDGVAAVLQSEGTPVAKLAYVVESRPVKGSSFTLRLLASSAAAIPALEVAAASDGLEVVPATGVIAVPAGDAQAMHALTITPLEEGLVALTVRLKVDGNETVYAVPVLVMAAGEAPAGKGGG